MQIVASEDFTERIVEQSVGELVGVPQTQEQIAEVVLDIPQELVRGWTIAQFVDAPRPQRLQRIGAQIVDDSMPQRAERVQQRIVEQLTIPCRRSRKSPCGWSALVERLLTFPCGGRNGADCRRFWPQVVPESQRLPGRQKHADHHTFVFNICWPVVWTGIWCSRDKPSSS